MSQQYQMRFAGSGGQGVILASVILAEAAVICGFQAVQSQAYGPEARGGVSKAETVVSKEQIWYSKVLRPDFLLALNQSSLNAYAPSLAEGGVVMIDDSLSAAALPEGTRFIAVPILRTCAWPSAASPPRAAPRRCRWPWPDRPKPGAGCACSRTSSLPRPWSAISPRAPRPSTARRLPPGPR